MPQVPLAFIDVTAILAVIILGDCAFLYAYFHRIQPSKGYVWPAFQHELSRYHAEIVVYRALIAIAVLWLGSLVIPFLAILPIRLLTIALIAASAFVVGFRADVRVGRKGTVDWYRSRRPVSILRRPGTSERAMPWMLTLRVRYSHAIQKRRQQDNYDLMHSLDGPWADGRSFSQTGRVIRQLWEWYKRGIAQRTRRPELARHVHNTAPFQYFYNLVAHLGRGRLMRELNHPPAFSWDWDGMERRRPGQDRREHPTRPWPEERRNRDRRVA